MRTAFAQDLKPFMGSDSTHLGLLNANYEVVIPPTYTFIMSRKFGFWAKKSETQQGVLNSKGQVTVPLQYDHIATWGRTGLVRILKNKLWGMAHPKTGKVVCAPRFKKLYYPHNGEAHVIDSTGLEGIININGTFAVKPIYKNIGYISEELRVVQNQQNKHGFINRQGKVMIPCRYDDALPFNKKGFAKVAVGKQWYFINKQGVLVNKTATPKKEYHPEPDEDFFVCAPYYPTPVFPKRLKGTVYSYGNVGRVVLKNFRTYCKRNLRIPYKAREKGIRGEVILQFIVTEQGYIRQVKVLKGLGHGMDEAAISMLKRMPRWLPARFCGKIASLNTMAVYCSYNRR